MSTISAPTSGSTSDAAPPDPPDLCRVTVLARHTQVDLALPAAVPLALLIPGIADLIDEHRRYNRFDDSPANDRLEPRQWVLARIGRPPLATTATLAELGIRDGELLALAEAGQAAPPPLFDDVMDAVATATSRSRRWTPATARLLGSIVALASITIGCVGLVDAGGSGTDLIGAFGAATTAVILLIAGVVASRIYADPAAAQVLFGCALPAGAAAGILLVPGPLGTADLLLSAAAAGALAMITIRATGTGQTAFTAVTTIAGYTTIGAATALLTPVPTRSIVAALIAAGLAGLALAPRIALLLARLPLPTVPAPDSPIEPADDLSPGPDRPDGSDPARVAESSARAGQYLTGQVAGSALVVTASTLITAPANAPTWPGIALAGVVAAVLAFRGRTYVDAEQAGWLIAAGAGIVLGLLLGAAVAQRAPLAVYAAASTFALGASALGILGPRTDLSPPLRRAGELIEYACVAAVLPLTCWVAGLFQLIRGL